MTLTGEQSDANKVETGSQDVQSPETQDKNTDLQQQQSREKTQAAQELSQNKAETTKRAAEARAEVLVSTPVLPPNSEKAPGEPSETPPQPPTATAVKTDWGEKLKGLGAQISTFLGGLMTKLKGVFSSITAKFSEWFGKKKQPETPNNPPEAAVSTNVETSSEEGWEQVIRNEAKRLRIEPAFLLAVLRVEAGTAGPFSKETGKPIIRFEPHIFNSHNKGTPRAGWGKNKLVGRHVENVSCEGGQTNEQKCFQKAIEINPDAAYKSISMGQPQIMGFNAGIAGYSSAQQMYEAFSNKSTGAVAQIKAMIRLIEKSPGILSACKNKDVGSFTRRYNGSKPGSALYARYTASMTRYYNRYKSQESGGETRVA